MDEPQVRVTKPAGRKPGSKNRTKTHTTEDGQIFVENSTRVEGITPLQLLLAVMQAEYTRYEAGQFTQVVHGTGRNRRVEIVTTREHLATAVNAAKDAAPYVHAKLAPKEDKPGGGMSNDKLLEELSKRLPT